MSRAVNVTIDPQATQALCDRHSIPISTIEGLPAGGTRVVLITMAAADTLRGLLRGKIINGPVVRSGLHLGRRLLPPGR